MNNGETLINNRAIEFMAQRAHKYVGTLEDISAIVAEYDADFHDFLLLYPTEDKPLVEDYLRERFLMIWTKTALFREISCDKGLILHDYISGNHIDRSEIIKYLNTIIEQPFFVDDANDPHVQLLKTFHKRRTAAYREIILMITVIDCERTAA